jgi:hypothetical protein
MWKMLHLLRLYARSDPQHGWSLTGDALMKAGVNCMADTIYPLVQSGAVEEPVPGIYRLGSAARAVLDRCVVANRRWASASEFQIDEPSVFVIMPFSESWSSDVWSRLIQPAVTSAGLRPVRGDMPVRVSDLSNTIWDAILSVGVVVADLSAPNTNVFYELGIAHALGKDTFILKQRDTRLPADFGGAHFYEYALGNIDAARDHLSRDLIGWRELVKADGVAELAASGVVTGTWSGARCE